MKNIYLGAYWKGDKSTAQQFLMKSFYFIQDLREFFQDYFPELNIVTPAGDFIPFPDQLSVYKETILPLLYNEEAWYFYPDGSRKNEIALETTCDSGFDIQCFFENEDDAVSISIQGGQHKIIAPDGHIYGHLVPNRVLIEYAMINTDLQGYDLNYRLLKQVIETWQPAHALITSNEMFTQTRQDGEDFSVGWINYIKSLPSVVVLPETIRVERLGNQRIFTISEVFPVIEDPQVRARVLELKGTLNATGALQWS